jgi:RNA polymerase sigma factor (sigma-70 family)
MRSFYRSQKKLKLISLDVIEEHYCNSIEEDFLSCEEKNAVINLLGGLDERQHSIVTLKYYADLSNKEIRKILELSESNISTILSRTIKKMKNMLNQCDESAFFAYKE